jgi:hypothetical protein
MRMPVKMAVIPGDKVDIDDIDNDDTTKVSMKSLHTRMY